MDFNDTAEEAEFRTGVRAWLKKNAVLKDDVTDEMRAKVEARDPIEYSKEWQAKKADAGYACMLWPEAYGGSGAPVIHQVIYNQEESKYFVPGGVFRIGIGMCGPTMMSYATEEQRERYLPKMARGEEIWSQLFSEPAAGSDVAGLRMRADRDGEEWILNGQKVWTSGAHYSDYGIIVARHDPSAPKHKGLTFFFIDMKSPGIEIKPIKQISGDSNFCEVFFRDVRVPDSQRLGEVGQGWRVAITTLMNERLAVGDASPPYVEDVLEFARQFELDSGPALKNPEVRSKLADWYVQSEGIKNTKYRTMTALSRGQTPGPEASIAKIVSAQKLQDMASFAMDLQDMAGGIVDAELAPEKGIYQEAFLASPGSRIAGGTDEILRNIIAERVLGLPQDIRVDKKDPFNKLPTGPA